MIYHTTIFGKGIVVLLLFVDDSNGPVPLYNGKPIAPETVESSTVCAVVYISPANKGKRTLELLAVVSQAKCSRIGKTYKKKKNRPLPSKRKRQPTKETPRLERSSSHASHHIDLVQNIPSHTMCNTSLSH